MAYVIVDMDAAAHGGEEMPLPTRRRSRMLRVGWFAKLRFEESPSRKKPAPSEYLWVKVEVALSAEDRYEGILVESPAVVPDLKPGDSVSFEPKNVVDFVDG